MNVAVDWLEVTELLKNLYKASDRLEALFPGRKFTLDGHLVGSIGEVIAAYMFGLELLPASSQAHDAVAPDGRKVQIKLTQGSSVAINHEPEHMIVLQRPKDGHVRVVFNGPGAIAWAAAGQMGRNGQRPISIRTLAALNDDVEASSRVPLVRPVPL